MNFPYIKLLYPRIFKTFFGKAVFLKQIISRLPYTASTLFTTAIWLYLSIMLLLPSEARAQLSLAELNSMSLEELLSIEVKEGGTLSDTSLRQTPAAMTTVTSDMIRGCGARSLDKVLEIFVPNLEIARNYFGPDSIGLRGIIGNNNDKILLLINGRVMNQRLKTGAFSELDLPMLEDIDYINVIRGPGSAIYGPGAVAGVISIVTRNGENFNGFDINTRQGLVEWFTSMEMRGAYQFDNGASFFLDYGFTDYAGADQDDSPYTFGKTFSTPDNSYLIESEKPVSFDIVDDHKGYRSCIKQKIHAEYTSGGLDTWIRYTSGGMENPPLRQQLANPPIGSYPENRPFSSYSFNGRGYGYQQLTIYSKYEHEVIPGLSADITLSYDMFDYEAQPPTKKNSIKINSHKTAGSPHFNSSREDEYYVRLLTHWIPHTAHSLSMGAAWSYEIFGMDSPGFPHLHARTQAQGEVDDWSTNTWSLLGEYKWDITGRWTAFASGRLDKHTYTDWLFSPRAAVIFMPTENDTIKFMGNQSVRRASDDELRAQHSRGHGYSDNEKIKTGEVRYERLIGNSIFAALSGFYQDVELVAWNIMLQRSNRLADYKVWGLEAEFRWQKPEFTVSISHAYTKLLDFNLSDPDTVQPWSAAPYGYGHDLAIWSDNLTKLFVSYSFTEGFSVDGSLQIYWGFTGAHDQTRYNNKEGTFPTSTGLGLSDPDYDKAFKGNYYLNLGSEIQFNQHWSTRLDLYNILGWIDKDLNKRNFTERVSEYRSEAASAGISLRYSF